MSVFIPVYYGIELIGMLVGPDTPVIGVTSLFIELSEASMIRLPPMCGRFIQAASPAAIAQLFHVATPPLFAPCATD